MLSNEQKIPDLAESDLELARAAGQQDPGARRLLAERLFTRVRTTVHYLAPQDRDADDLVQRSLVEILSSVKGFRGESRLETWADRITVRTCMRALKKRQRRDQSVSLVGDVLTVQEREGGAVARDLARPRNPQEQTLSQRQLRQRLSLKLQRLTAARRMAMILRWVFGYSLKEIAELTEAPVNTVRDRLQVGKRQLRAMILKDSILRDWAEMMES